VAWDWRATGVNLLNVLSRRPEAYHRTLSEAAASGTLIVAGQPARFDGAAVRAKEAGLEKKLIYDAYRRAGLIDHILPLDATLDAFYRAAIDELGDFVDRPYTAKTTKPRGEVILSLAREGSVRAPADSGRGQAGGGRLPLRIEKKIAVKPGESGLTATYTLTNLGDRSLAARFGVETNWGMSGGDSSQGAYIVWPGGVLKRLNAIDETLGVKEAAIVHERVGRVVVRVSEAGTWWQFPIETVSNSEAGFERVYQGTSLLAHWPIDLAPAGAWKLSLTFALVPASD
jgi:alpha-amylase